MLRQVPRRGVSIFCLLFGLGAASCTGQITSETRENGRDSVAPGGGGVGPGAPPGASVPPPAAGTDRVFFGSAVRRLTKGELRGTLSDLLGLDLQAELAKFPEDYSEANDVFAFDNRYTHQEPSAALIEAARNLADIAGARVLSDEATRRRLLPCTPSGAGDEGCLRAFVTSFGRRVLRRPLDQSEIDAYVAKTRPAAVEANDFHRAVSLVVRAMLQDVEFLYRTEIGVPVENNPGLFKLTGPELASRLAFFLWGTAPDEALLETAVSGERLQTPAAIRAAAERMLGDARTRRGVARFHGLWLGYERQAPTGTLAAAMAEETRRLIEKVIFEEKRPWLDLFRADQTYLDGPLAAHYGLPAPAGGAGWVSYGGSGRQGILSHGTFLGVERKHEDTSPTMRGAFIRGRLLCQVIPPPPPELMVDVDAVPTEGNCKSDRYAMWKRNGCQGCHVMMDPIGHGLERYDRTGRQRTLAPSDSGKPECELSGQGELVAGAGSAPFTGVAGLSDLLVQSGALEGCLTTQLASYLLGRQPRGDEAALFERVAARFAAGNHRFDQMLLDIVGLPGFGYRLAE
jgi:Protein of unknown function (DUF1592)/Protein of unknown function (DUF1588)/Protein of unknown function (DUF1595)/Protein of unknown function (DUF1585)/Protein of unknown function (DUF1587)